MKAETLILRGVSLHAQALSVGRPVQKRLEKSTPPEARYASGSGDVAVHEIAPSAPSDLLNSASVTSAMGAGGPPSELASELAQEQKRLIEQEHRTGYEKGFQDGIAHAQREARQQAEKAAMAMAQEQIDHAVVNAQKAARDQSGQLNEKLTRQRELIEGLLRKVPDERDKCLRDAEEDMVALAFEMVCSILGEKVATQEGLRSLLERNLKSWHGRSPLSIHLHPEDVHLLRADADSLQLLSAAGFSGERATLRWVADAKVAIGGLFFRASEGALDARLEIQLDALKASLLQTREARKSPAQLHERGERP